MEAQIEEVRLLQTSMLLLTTTDFVRGETLAKCLVLCFRLLDSADFQVNHTASAIIRQAVCTVFDRIKTPTPPANGLVYHSSGAFDKSDEHLTTAARDGLSLFQDLCHFANGDAASWMIGIDSAKIRKSFCLEMIEIILEQYYPIFAAFSAFNFLLREKVGIRNRSIWYNILEKYLEAEEFLNPYHRANFEKLILFKYSPFQIPSPVCNLIIASFSPNWKTWGKNDSYAELQLFVISSRVLKIVAILLESYNCILKTESEIFLSFLIKFLDGEKWQRAIAVEVLHKICWRPKATF